MPIAIRPTMSHVSEQEKLVRPSFEQTYNDYFDFVWLSLRRLGVAAEQLDDATQDVFVVVCRKLSEFEYRSQLKTWLFAIALRVARSHRRGRPDLSSPVEPEQLPSASASPHEALAEARALRLVGEVLDSMDEEQRAVFIMAELEQIPVPEVAQVLNLNLNTTYSRLRLARQHFNACVARHRAQERRQP
jgi:RNA polymerase sigma-70 factor (ECF subfamily)